MRGRRSATSNQSFLSPMEHRSRLVEGKPPTPEGVTGGRVPYSGCEIRCEIRAKPARNFIEREGSDDYR